MSGLQCSPKASQSISEVLVADLPNFMQNIWEVTDVSEEYFTSIVRATGISKLGTLAVTSNRSTLRRDTVQNLLDFAIHCRQNKTQS
jgi:hypothetical protein